MKFEELVKPKEMRANVIEAIERLDIPTDELIVVGGAALQVYGIKLSEDIDAVVTESRFEQTLDKDNGRENTLGRIGILATATNEEGGQVIEDEGYGVYRSGITYMLAPNDSLYRATFEELHDEAVNFDGVLVSPPSRILEWKRGVNRPKDIEDIGLIEAHLALTTNK